MKIGLDTNMLVDQSLASTREEEYWTKRLRNAVKILELFTNEEINLIVSEWNLLEYQTVMQDIWLEKKLTELGYHAREFREANRSVKLTKDELKDVKDIVDIIRNDSEVETHEIEFNFVQKLADIGVELMDAVLIFQAMKSNCKYFVTRDDALYNKIKNLDIGIEIVKPEQFLKLQESKRDKSK